MSAELELRGPISDLLDDPLLLRARGVGPEAELSWRARLRDDDGRVWRSGADSPEALAAGWQPAKAGTGVVAALGSLRPVTIEVRAEAPDGRAASRTLTRRLLADGVRARRWRDSVRATLYLPAAPQPCAAVLLDATGDDAQRATAAMLAAPLLASRGALVLAVLAGLEPARDRLAAVPSAAAREVQTATAVLPPGVPSRDDPEAAAARASAWDALLAALGALPRGAGAANGG